MVNVAVADMGGWRGRAWVLVAVEAAMVDFNNWIGFVAVGSDNIMSSCTLYHDTISYHTILLVRMMFSRWLVGDAMMVKGQMMMSDGGVDGHY